MMPSHLSEGQLIGYLYRTLTDATREELDRHLEMCTPCRTRLAHHEQVQHQIHHDLRSAIRRASPSPAMNYASLRNRLHDTDEQTSRWAGLLAASYVGTAIAGLALALASLSRLLPVVNEATAGAPRPDSGWLVAAAFLTVSAVGGYGQASPFPARRLLEASLAILLWLGTAILGLPSMLVLWQLFIAGLVALSGISVLTFALGGLVVLSVPLLYVLVVVGGGEYHVRRVGQASSWRLFAVTIIAQLLIMLMGRL